MPVGSSLNNSWAAPRRDDLSGPAEHASVSEGRPKRLLPRPPFGLIVKTGIVGRLALGWAMMPVVWVFKLIRSRRWLAGSTFICLGILALIVTVHPSSHGISQEPVDDPGLVFDSNAIRKLGIDGFDDMLNEPVVVTSGREKPFVDAAAKNAAGRQSVAGGLAPAPGCLANTAPGKSSRSPELQDSSRPRGAWLMGTIEEAGDRVATPAPTTKKHRAKRTAAVDQTSKSRQ